jgi:acyl-homoserine lactone acylase PvdQ
MRRSRFALVLTAVTVAAAIAALSASPGYAAAGDGANIPGLRAPASVVRDVDGVPHIKAGNAHVPAVPSRRFVAQATPDGGRSVDSLPGGVSEDLGSRFEQNLLGDWLTNETYPVRMFPRDLVGAVDSVTRFLPKRGR